MPFLMDIAISPMEMVWMRFGGIITVGAAIVIAAVAAVLIAKAIKKKK